MTPVKVMLSACIASRRPLVARRSVCRRAVPWRGGQSALTPRPRMRPPRAVAEPDSSPESTKSSIKVKIDNSTSAAHTVVTVTARDSPGLLTAMTATFRDLDLEVARADVTTKDGVLNDTFCVVDAAGGKITDAGVLQQLETALSLLDTPSSGVRAGRPAFRGSQAPRTATSLMGTPLLPPRCLLLCHCPPEHASRAAIPPHPGALCSGANAAARGGTAALPRVTGTLSPTTTTPTSGGGDTAARHHS